MTEGELLLFFQPKGVAVIGASRDPQKLGYSVIHNLVTHRYPGAIYPINPNADEILGHKAYPSMQEVPDPVELAVIVVPAKYVTAALEDCGKRGVKAVTIVSGGFREVGPEGVEREEQLKAIAAQYGIAVLGPNCIGSIDTHTPMNATFVTKGHPNPGEIGMVSQSGALAASIIDWATGSGVGFSRIVSLGNQAGVTEADMLAPTARDAYTRVVTAYIEGVSNGQAFLQAAAAVSKRLPVIALKAGRGKSGAKAVASHTGALAGSEEAYNAAFRRAGVLRANSLEEMLDWARALAWQPLPNGNRVAVLTNAGGPGILSVDALEAHGMQLAPLTEETRNFLRQRVPPAASIANPVDILAGSGPATYALCLDALLADQTVDAVVVMTAPQDWFDPLSLAEVVGEVANTPLGRRKPVLAVIMGVTTEATRVLHRRRTPNFDFPERVGSTLAAMWQRKQWLDAQADVPATKPPQVCDPKAAEAVLQNASDWLTPPQIETLMGAYCIRTPRAGFATSVEEALQVTDDIGYPVVVKVMGLTHKTEAGGVRLNIRDDQELSAVATELLGKGDGLLIQNMVRGGVELIVGVVRDPQFGPLVMVGSGGTQVELLGDVAFELAPVTRQQAGSMLDRTAAGRLLEGFRGQPSGDREAVIDMIQLLAQVALDWPQVAEIEINPVIALAEGAYAVDVRVRVE